MIRDVANIRVTVYIGQHPFKEETLYYDYDESKMKKSWEAAEPEYMGPYDSYKIENDAAKQWLKAHKDEIKEEIIEDIKSGKIKITIGVTDSDMWEIDDEKEEVIHL